LFVLEDLMQAVAEKPSQAAVKPSVAPARAALRGKTFRCFAYKHSSGGFVAECVDLNLIVKAKTMKKAASSLGDAIEGYLEVVANGDDQTGLIPRPSPLSHRIRYHAIGTKLRVARALNSVDGLTSKMKQFECPVFCHAQ
jgi:hypothetical protein